MDIEAIMATIGGVLAALWAGWQKFFKDKGHKEETPKELADTADDRDAPEIAVEAASELKNDVLDALVAQADIYSALNEAAEKSGAQRAILIHTNNCGDRILHTGTQLYATVFAEVHNGAPAVRPLYQQRPISDPYYVMMLRELAMAGKTILITDKLSDDMELKGTYARAGLKEAHVYLCHAEPGKIWYVSVAFEDKPPKYVDSMLRDCANKIRQILKRPIFDGGSSDR